MVNASIDFFLFLSIFYCNKKFAKNRQELLHRPNICIKLIENVIFF